MSEIVGLPFQIKLFDGPAGRKVAFKCYPSGVQIPATDEEALSFDIMAKMAAEIKELKATATKKGGK